MFALLFISLHEYDDCITMKKQCKTINGTLCVFPFIFRGKEVTNCITTRKRTQPWCPTQTDSSTGVPIRRQWGYCDDQCSTEGSEISNYYSDTWFRQHIKLALFISEHVASMTTSTIASTKMSTLTSKFCQIHCYLL